MEDIVTDTGFDRTTNVTFSEDRFDAWASFGANLYHAMIPTSILTSYLGVL